MGTIIVPRDGRYVGSGSKQTTINYDGASTIMQVQESFDDGAGDWTKSALIENLIIDGLNYSNTTGIYLENVYKCFIRNLTIKNCDVGIHLRNTGGKWTEFNRIEHVRMSNVKTGIKFSTNGEHYQGLPGDSTGFTKIDDVGIALKNDANSVGILIGDGNSLKIKPYSSYIKANVWMQSAGGAGMELDSGELQFGLINFAVSGPSNGYGIKGTNAVIANNQPFRKSDGTLSKGVFLTCAGISNYVDGVSTSDIDIKAW